MRKPVILLSFVFLALIVPSSVFAEEKQWTLLEKVRQGQELLQKYKIPKPSKPKKGEDRIALAALDKNTGEIEIIDISVVNKKAAVLGDKDWKILMLNNNGVNTEFKVISPESQLVVAMKYPVTLRNLNKKGIEVRYPEDVVYSAYSKDLESPEILGNGQAYVDNLIAGAYNKLEALGTKSRAFPDKKITEVLNRQMVESLILIEHIGTTTLLGDFDGALRRLYTTFGLNTTNTFNYSRSSAGARGIAQFMPKTYKSLRASRPDLGLIAYFEDAMTDHPNSILAQVAFMDIQLNVLPNNIKERAFADPVLIGEYLAASYNGGSSRVSYAIRAWGELWNADHFVDIAKENIRHKSIDAKISQLKSKIKKAQTNAEAKKLRAELGSAQKDHDDLVAKIAFLKKGSLKAETINYLNKLRPVYAHLSLKQNMMQRMDEASRLAFKETEAAAAPILVSPAVLREEVPKKRIKFQTDSKIYAASPDGIIRWITSEELAKVIYGDDWRQGVEELSDAFFANYRLGDPVYAVSETAPPDSSQVAFGG
ncbi:hypothetical protein HYT45_03195 [Candidatus Uhrbacteria bacterium]|nr:hypothetical protein [Candidatus Uhrbacteria bacterium]